MEYTKESSTIRIHWGIARSREDRNACSECVLALDGRVPPQGADIYLKKTPRDRAKVKWNDDCCQSPDTIQPATAALWKHGIAIAEISLVIIIRSLWCVLSSIGRLKWLVFNSEDQSYSEEPVILRSVCLGYLDIRGIDMVWGDGNEDVCGSFPQEGSGKPC